MTSSLPAPCAFLCLLLCSAVCAARSCKVGLTVGYALALLDGHDAASLLQRADAAMYAGKQAGKHTLRRGQALVRLVSA